VKWRLSKDFIDEDRIDSNIGEIVFFRRANHLTPVKKELALQAMFPDKSNGRGSRVFTKIESVSQNRSKD
jgi:hypothetical protein